MGVTPAQLRLAMNGLKQLSDTEWQIEAPTGRGRSQTVYLAYSEAMGQGFLSISTAITIVTRSGAAAATVGISATAEADLFPLLREIGGLAVGGLGFAPIDDQTGALTVRTVIPLSVLDLSNPDALPTYVAHLAALGDLLEERFGARYGKTNAKDAF